MSEGGAAGVLTSLGIAAVLIVPAAICFAVWWFSRSWLSLTGALVLSLVPWGVFVYRYASSDRADPGRED
jgi:F0F1-type ATP synthase assembly protein I